MYGLSIGVSSIGEALPRSVYAVLSGLNAATVGVIALAAVELSNKAITDKLSRTLLFLSGAAGMLYNALWYFPTLMFACGVAAVMYDYHWLHGPVRATMGLIRRRSSVAASAEDGMADPGRETATHDSRGTEMGRMRQGVSSVEPSSTARTPNQGESPQLDSDGEAEQRIIPQEYRLGFSWKVGTGIIAAFLVTFIVVMVLRSTLPNPPLLYQLFANLYLAGTIIFGGGPVVIPLLREYVVAEGWVSPRDFIIGLAIVQSFPGPNFNFAVFLGGLAASNSGLPSAWGAMIGFLAIFFPGLALVHGTMGVWGSLRSKPWVKSVLRGVNAGAVGLIYTAIYRIWQVGYIDEGFQSGTSLGNDPWWVVVTATAYVGGRYYGIVAPLAILLGAGLGLVRYGVVSSQT